MDDDYKDDLTDEEFQDEAYYETSELAALRESLNRED